MFCRAGRLVLAATSVVNPRACYQNMVNSDAMALLERQCEKCCYVPRFPEQKVTIIGAGSDVGRIASLFLKQQSVIKTLALYEECPERGVLGVANDIAHIDTSTEIEAYQGRAYLKPALDKAEMVLVCGGSCAAPHYCDLLDRDLFLLNMNVVRAAVQGVAHFAPNAFVAVQTPPVDCNFTLAMHDSYNKLVGYKKGRKVDTFRTARCALSIVSNKVLAAPPHEVMQYILKLARVYNKRRLLGVNTITAMRATQLYCAASGANPCQARVPAVGGTGRCTRVPVFSCSNPHVCDKVPGEAETSCITRLVRESDDIIYRIKCNNGHGHLSIGFACARTVLSIMTGLFEKPTEVDSALVEQDDPEMCYGMQICATPVTIGRDGIETYKIPKLNEKEKKLLEESKCDLEDMLNLGRCYATGEEYYLNPCKVCQIEPCPHCPCIGELK